jgi:hypothetical protein
MNKPLSHFSKLVAVRLFESFPQWAYLQNSMAVNAAGEFSLRVPPPSTSSADLPLVIDTHGDRINIAFDAYHTRFKVFSDPCEYDGAKAAIQNLISDHYAVVSFWNNDEWCGSALYDENHLPTDNIQYPHANKIKIRSWSGALDDEIICSPKA